MSIRHIHRFKSPLSTLFIICTLTWIGTPIAVAAHCDTMDGPVIRDAREALKTGGIEPVLKWIHKPQESELETAFQKALAIRTKDAQVREIADKYFFETLVRLHRESENAPYTGLKPAGSVEPIIKLSDKALERGDANELIEKINVHTARGIREKFEKAHQAREQADESAQKGREYVDAYVEYVHFTEGIHAVLKGGHGH